MKEITYFGKNDKYELTVTFEFDSYQKTISDHCTVSLQYNPGLMKSYIDIQISNADVFKNKKLLWKGIKGGISGFELMSTKEHGIYPKEFTVTLQLNPGTQSYSIHGTNLHAQVEDEPTSVYELNGASCELISDATIIKCKLMNNDTTMAYRNIVARGLRSRNNIWATMDGNEIHGEFPDFVQNVRGQIQNHDNQSVVQMLGTALNEVITKHKISLITTDKIAVCRIGDRHYYNPTTIESNVYEFRVETSIHAGGGGGGNVVFFLT